MSFQGTIDMVCTELGKILPEGIQALQKTYSEAIRPAMQFSDCRIHIYGSYMKGGMSNALGVPEECIAKVIGFVIQEIGFPCHESESLDDDLKSRNEYLIKIAFCFLCEELKRDKSRVYLDAFIDGTSELLGFPGEAFDEWRAKVFEMCFETLAYNMDDESVSSFIISLYRRDKNSFLLKDDVFDSVFSAITGKDFWEDITRLIDFGLWKKGAFSYDIFIASVGNGFNFIRYGDHEKSSLLKERFSVTDDFIDDYSGYIKKYDSLKVDISPEIKKIYDCFRKALPDDIEVLSELYHEVKGCRKSRGEFYDTYVKGGLSACSGLSEDDIVALVKGCDDSWNYPYFIEFPYKGKRLDASVWYVLNLTIFLVLEEQSRSFSRVYTDAIIARVRSLFASDVDRRRNPWRSENVPTLEDCVCNLSECLSDVSCYDFMRSVYREGRSFEVCSRDGAREVFLKDFNMRYALHNMEIALWKNGDFSYEVFKNAVLSSTSFIRPTCLESFEYEGFGDSCPDDFVKRYSGYSRKLMDEMIFLLPDSIKYIEISDWRNMKGIYWFEKGLQLLEKLCFTKEDFVSFKREPWKVNICSAIEKLVNIFSLSDSDKELLPSVLGKYKTETIEVAFPMMQQVSGAALRKMGLDSLIDLHLLVLDFIGYESGSRFFGEQDIGNAEDSECGVVYNRDQWQKALDRVKQKDLEKYAGLLKDSYLNIPNTLVLVDALRGKGRSGVEKKLTRHVQPAIRIYGAFPAESSEDILGRYLTFKKIYVEAAKHGEKRQENTRAAVQAGLKNLAISSGYPDVARLEWAMEPRLLEQGIKPGIFYAVDGYEIGLNIVGLNPVLVVRKSGKEFKNVPAKIKKSDVYFEVIAHRDQLKDQLRRFAVAMERAMCNGDEIDGDTQQLIMKLPLVKAMLARTVCYDTAGQFGFYVDIGQLESVSGDILPVQRALRIAHVHDLHVNGVLVDWRRHIYRLRLMQPFKQVFRELYFATSGELASEGFSRRFQGCVLSGERAARLLQRRGWRQSGDEVEVLAYKSFPSHRMHARLTFQEARYILQIESHLVIDTVSFHNANGVTLFSKVDPLLFSEVMRDIDLLVSVAQREGDDLWSSEMKSLRADIMEEVVNGLALDNVHFENSHIVIRGKLTEYRIHLGSGQVMAGVGSHIVLLQMPTEGQSHDVFVPFPDAGGLDQLIGKLLLLANDGEIRDESILAQIRQSVAR